MPQNTPRKQSGARSRQEGQNTDARFVEETKKRLLSEQLREDIREDRLERGSEATRDAELQQERYRTAETIKLEPRGEQVLHELQQRRVEQTTLRTRGDGSPLKLIRLVGISTLVMASMFQFFFATASAVWFGLEATKDTGCSTVGGKLVCGTVNFGTSAIDFALNTNITTLLTFENVGWVLWVFVVIITILVHIGFSIFFIAQKIPAYGSVGAVLFAGLCVSLNLYPFLNILPWIELWAGYWIVSGALPKSLSNVVKKA